MPNTSPAIVAMTLFVVTEPKPPTVCPRIENDARLAEIGVLGHLECQGVIDADAEIVLPFLDHVLHDGDDVAGPHVAAAQACRAGIDPRHAIDSLLAVLPGDGVAKRRLDFAGEMVARRRKRIVHPLQHGERHAMAQGFDNLPCRERTEAADVQAADFDAPFAREGNRPPPVHVSM